MNPIPLGLIDGAYIIDNSGIEKLRCPRFFQQGFVLRRDLATAKAGRNFGSAMHVGRAIRYKRCGSKAVTPEVVSEINDAMFKWFEAHPQPIGDHRTFDRAVKQMEWYNKCYGLEPFHILNNQQGRPIIEASFALPIGHVQNTPIIYAGKLDLGVEDNNGIWSHDMKTAFMFGEGQDMAWQMDGGQIGYTWALKEVLGPGAKVNGYIIDGVRVRRPTKAHEVSGEYPIDASDFKRLPFFVDDATIEDWKQNTLALVADIFWNHDRGYFPMHRWNCVTKYGPCDFLNVCSLAPSQRANALASNMFEDSDWSPLRPLEE